MYKLAIIPSDPIAAYKSKGIAAKLEDYYNPMHFFGEVYLLSPLEKEERYEFGAKIIPTRDKQLKRRIRELGIDVVRAYGAYWPCDMACNYKVDGVPVVVSVHDRRPGWMHETVKKADIVFAVSEEVRRLVLTKFNNPSRIWLLPNRVDLNIMRPVPEDKFSDLKNRYPFRFKILHVGRKSGEKNLDTLLRALKILGNEYCLLAIGVGETDKYVELAKEEGVADRYYFMNSVRNEDLPRYFSWADCMCNPSRQEAMSSVLIEALACESVVVTSSIAAAGANIEHMKNGLIVRDYENPQALAGMIETACNDEGVRTALKSNARKSVRRFEKNRIEKVEAEYYEKILAMAKGKEFSRPFWRKLWGY